MINQAELGGMIEEEATPWLKEAVKSPSFTVAAFEDLALRSPICGVATALLQIYLRQKEIETTRLIAYPDKLPRGLNSRRLAHVALFCEDGTMIDPTFGQFFNLVGLTAGRAHTYPQLRQLYPAQYIAVIAPGEHEAFSRTAARIAEDAKAPVGQVIAACQDKTSVPPIDTCATATPAELSQVYESIWDPAGYVEPFPLEQQPDIEEAAHRTVSMMRAKKSGVVRM